MSRQIEAIGALPGVKGVWDFHGSEGIRAEAQAGNPDRQKIGNACRLFAHMTQLGYLHVTGVQTMTLDYGDDCFTIRRTAPQQFLIVQYRPDADLLRIQKCMEGTFAEAPVCVPEQRQTRPPIAPGKPRVTAPKAAPPASQPPQPAAVKPAEDPKITARRMMQEGTMSTSLSGMERALVKVMGPMATVIFQESLTQWVMSCPATPETLPVFIDILHLQINDMEKIKQYRKLISPYLKAIRMGAGQN